LFYCIKCDRNRKPCLNDEYDATNSLVIYNEKLKHNNKKMKRKGNIFQEAFSFLSLVEAHKRARKGKRHYREVKKVDKSMIKYLSKLSYDIRNKNFTTSDYIVNEQFDGRKMRVIHKLPYFPDRVVQHALIGACEELFKNSMIRDSFQSIKGRGTSDARNRVLKCIKEKNPKYALKIDIKKYYPSVDNEILKQKIRKKIKCKDTLYIFDNIIDSTKGLPIGNYTSQYLGNIYLNDFDWFVKQKIKPLGYFRYCDDMVFLSNRVSSLLKIKKEVEEKLALLKLEIKDSWNISNIEKDGVDFVGFVFKKETTRLRKTIATRLEKIYKNLGKKTLFLDTDLNKLMAYKGWVSLSDSKQLFRRSLNRNLYEKYSDQFLKWV
jgi:RNA-directed DNA polymerase